MLCTCCGCMIMELSFLQTSVQLIRTLVLHPCFVHLHISTLCCRCCWWNQNYWLRFQLPTFLLSCLTSRNQTSHHMLMSATEISHLYLVLGYLSLCWDQAQIVDKKHVMARILLFFPSCVPYRSFSHNQICFSNSLLDILSNLFFLNI